MNSFPKEQVLAACDKYGVLLSLPPQIDGKRLMAAFAMNESSLGANCKPRHEPAFDVGGRYGSEPVMASLLRQYGSAAACSYGPWQVMLINAPGFSPNELESSLDDCARSFVSFFNSYVIRQHRADTMEQMGQVYNAGSVLTHPSPGVRAYCLELKHNYDTLTLPAEEVAS